MGKLPTALIIGCAIAALCACNKSNRSMTTTTTRTTETNSSASASGDPVKSAMAAAPDSISKDATIVQVAADGSIQTLRQGKNGWTCMPDAPDTPGPDSMCMDGNALKWAQAWMGHKPPPANTVGIMYMLEGGTDASNTDPYARQPTADNDWIKTGPHIMVVGSRELLAGYPTGAKPYTAAPYVMWSGTPYAHLMIPVQ